MTKVLHEVRDRVELLVELRQGLPGARGAPGAPGGSGLQYPAGVALGGHRVVYARADGKLDYASNLVAAHGDRVIGVTVASASANEDATLVSFGPIEEPSWNWVANTPVYLGTNGQMTQVPPASPAAFIMRIGVPTSPTSLFVNINNPLFLTA